jgi:hypothetical protein
MTRKISISSGVFLDEHWFVYLDDTGNSTNIKLLGKIYDSVLLESIKNENIELSAEERKTINTLSEDIIKSRKLNKEIESKLDLLKIEIDDFLNSLSNQEKQDLLKDNDD